MAEEPARTGVAHTEEFARTARFRGARFTESDLSGARFRDSDLRGVRIVSSAVDDMHISGFDGQAGRVLVDDVVVTEFVAAELDRRHPERVPLRAMRTADDFRSMWAVLESLWDETLARAERLPEGLRHQRVDDEWSFVETLRHLVFAVDSWVGRVVLGVPEPFHRLGLPHTDFPDDAPAQLGIDTGADPSYADVVAVHAARRDQVRAVLQSLTDDELEEVRTGTPMPGTDSDAFTVGTCLRVVLNEHCAHRRYAVRDLAALEASSDHTDRTTGEPG